LVYVPRPIVMDPALHCRIGLTKVGVAMRNLALYAHDLIRKPMTTPDHVRGRLFPEHARA
jgi:hypothetical protein